MRIKDIMTKTPITVTEDTSVKTISELMDKNGVGAIPVTDKRKKNLIGIITDRDIVLRCVSKNLNPEKTYAKDIMSAETVSICPENSITESARIMARKQIRRLPVCEQGKVIGMVSIGDISRSKTMFAETAAAFCDICKEYSEPED